MIVLNFKTTRIHRIQLKQPWITGPNHWPPINHGRSHTNSLDLCILVPWGECNEWVVTGKLWYSDLPSWKGSQMPGLTKLVGGFNLFEKYARQIGSFPQVRVKIKNVWNHHLVRLNRHLLKRWVSFRTSPWVGYVFSFFFWRIGKQEFTETKCSDLFTFVGRLFQKVRTQGMTLNLRSFLDSFPCLHHIKIWGWLRSP